MSLLCRTPRKGYHDELTLMIFPGTRILIVTIHRVGIGVLLTLGTTAFGASWSPTAQAQVRLEYKFPEGKKLTYKTTSRVRQVLTFMNNMEKESVLRETERWTRMVGKQRSDSTFPIEEKVERLREEYTFPGGTKLTLDSSDPKLKVDNPDLKFLGDVFKLESAFHYIVLLDGQAKVKAVQGTEPFNEKVQKLDSPIARGIPK